MIRTKCPQIIANVCFYNRKECREDWLFIVSLRIHFQPSFFPPPGCITVGVVAGAPPGRGRCRWETAQRFFPAPSRVTSWDHRPLMVLSKAVEDALHHPPSDGAWRNIVDLLLRLKYQLPCKLWCLRVTTGFLWSVRGVFLSYVGGSQTVCD